MTHHELDETELRLIALLQEDGRMSTQSLAKRAGCSEVTARRKLRRLLDTGIVQIVAAVDPFVIGYESPVIMGLKVDGKKIDEIAETLCGHDAVRYVGAATGADDLIVEVVARTNHELSDFILGFLSKIDGVQATDTSLIVKIYKQSWSWGVRGVDDIGEGPSRRRSARASD